MTREPRRTGKILDSWLRKSVGGDVICAYEGKGEEWAGGRGT